MADPVRELPLPKPPAKYRLASPLLAVTAIILAIVIFIVDSITQLEIAVAALCTAIILLSVPIASRRTLLVIAGGRTAYTGEQPAHAG